AKTRIILRNFIKENNNLVGLSVEQIDNLKVTADYTNPNGELSFARLEQFVGDIPVFRAEIRAGFNKQNAMFRVINNLASNADYNSVSENFGNPLAAVEKAAGYIEYQLKETDTQMDSAKSTALKVVFGQGDWATTAEKMYFPIEGGVLRPSWRVLNWQKGDAYYVIVDAETGAMLYRENITHSQTQSATYNVYSSTNNLLKVLPNPAPLAAPGLLNPTLGTQGTLVPRTSVTFIGNEAPYTFNNLGWITDGTNGANGHTDGNNTEAGVDRNSPNGVDAPVQGTNRVFNFDYTPGAGPNNTGGDDPLGAAYQNGVSTNLFFVTNRYHDETYLLGFTEQARNFQNDNFGRGGAAADRVSAEAQDNTSGTTSCPTAPCYNNANFSTPADGGRGRMQMYLWNQPTPDRDGDLDAEIIVHELTHGLFGRLHNGTGGTQAGQMNEGNSDFFAHVLLAMNDDPINIVSTTGSYATLLLRGGTFTSNYYYGIRRFPKAVLAFTGGPNNRPHNPLTFKDIDPAQMSLTDGAFSPAFTGSATAVHDGGEIWSSVLWEVRAKLVQRLGAQAGNKKVLQLVMDGMKVSPSNPTMIQERNAILSAAIANGNGADVADLWAGFAVRGMGFSATNPTGNTVTEGNDLPNAVLAANGFSVSDAAPGGDGDGYPEPGETVKLNIPVVNNTGAAVSNVVVTVTNGGSANYGTIANGDTASQQISYTIPSDAVCGSIHTVSISITSNVGSSAAQTRSFRIGAPAFSGTTQNFDGVTAPALPTGWSQENSGSNTGWVTSTVLTSSAPNAAFSPSPALPGQADLNTSASITSAAAQLSFKNFYNSESTWDGMVLEIQIGNGAYQDILAAGGSFVSGGYNSAIDAQAGTAISGRQAWTGSSTNFVDTVVNLPASANGQVINIRFREASDTNTTATGTPGHRIDDFTITGGTLLSGYNCSSAPQTPRKVRADFDGDGKTDVSVFRASEGNWYMLRSTAGFGSTNWGTSTDKLVPGDYDGDGKTDTAVFRNGNWYVLKSLTNSLQSMSFGLATDTVVAGDYDGDNKTDAAVYRSSTNSWYVQRSSDNGFVSVTFGQSGDVPVTGDFDGDGKADITVFRNGQWITRKSSDSSVTFTSFGLATDKLVPADYEGDGKEDVAVFRPSNGVWYILRSSNGAIDFVSFGQNGDVPVPGDYDGDGKYDQAVYRNGNWYMNNSTSGFGSAVFGLGSDTAVPSAYLQ
ncbi:MAG TPA: M36 family metallopeptidase, partial [Pyrinomonadaceae bacterium]|nr:M36 family metallopeptidase [Pyrinomonadaceae bacterium]